MGLVWRFLAFVLLVAVVFGGKLLVIDGGWPGQDLGAWAMFAGVTVGIAALLFGLERLLSLFSPRQGRFGRRKPVDLLKDWPPGL